MFDWDALSRSSSSFISRRGRKSNRYKSEAASNAGARADSSPSAGHDTSDVTTTTSRRSSCPLGSNGKAPPPRGQPRFYSDTPLRRPRSLPLPNVTPPASPGGEENPAGPLRSLLRRPGEESPRANLRISFDFRDDMLPDVDLSLTSKTKMPHLLSRGDDDSSTSEEDS